MILLLVFIYVSSSLEQGYIHKILIFLISTIIIISIILYKRKNRSSLRIKKLLLLLFLILPIFPYELIYMADKGYIESKKQKEVVVWIKNTKYKKCNNSKYELVASAPKNFFSNKTDVLINQSEIKLKKNCIYKLRILLSQIDWSNNSIIINNIISWEIVTEPNYINQVEEKFLSSNSHMTNEWNLFSWSMLFGRPGVLDDNIRDRFSLSGSAHLLAVSGLHIGIVYVSSAFLVIYFFRRAICILISITLTLAYVLFVGCPESAVRALVMILAYESAKFMYTSVNPVFTLCWAGLFMLMYESEILHSLSFQMSFSVVLFILFAIKNNGFSLLNNFLLKYLLFNLLVSFSATVGCSILIAYYFGFISFGSILANFIIAPLIIPYFLLSCFNIISIYFFDFFNFDIIVEFIFNLIFCVVNHFSSYSVNITINREFSVLILVVFFFFLIASFTRIRWSARILMLSTYYFCITFVFLLH